MKLLVIFTMLVTLVACNEKEQGEVVSGTNPQAKTENNAELVMSPEVKRGDILCHSNAGDLLVSFVPNEKNNLKTFLVSYANESSDVFATKYNLVTNEELSNLLEQGLDPVPNEVIVTDTFEKIDGDGDLLTALSKEVLLIKAAGQIVSSQHIRLFLDLTNMEGSVEKVLMSSGGEEVVVELNKLSGCRKVE